MANVFSNGHFTSFNMVISSSINLLPFSLPLLSRDLHPRLTLCEATNKVKCISSTWQAISFLVKRLYSSCIVNLLHNIICSRGNFLFFATSWSSCIILESCIEKKYTELSMWLSETQRESNSSGRWALLARNISSSVVFNQKRFRIDSHRVGRFTCSEVVKARNTRKYVKYNGLRNNAHRWYGLYLFISLLLKMYRSGNF